MSTTMHMDRADKNKVGTAEIEDLRVIPVIFLPGIMGTNPHCWAGRFLHQDQKRENGYYILTG